MQRAILSSLSPRRISKKAKEKIASSCRDIPTDYANDDLVSGKDNFYDFTKQLVFTYGVLKKYIDQYGNRFVFELAPMRQKEATLPEQKEGAVPADTQPARV